MIPANERFDAKVSINEETGCWEWTGADNGVGYGKFYPTTNKGVYAHRYSYERHRGPIPEGLELDHLCQNPACVNPEHLEAVTHQVNMSRSKAASKTHCNYGHERTPENTYVRKNGRKWCAACYRVKSNAAYHRKKNE